jgi:exosortase/archaeosortase family protein
MGDGLTPAHRFILRAAAWSLGLFGLLRLQWIEAHVLLPLTSMQGGLSVRLLGAPAVPVEVTLACSGADAIALCLGAVLAYPSRWPTRVAGAAGGVALILALNTVRIGTLMQVAGAPRWFDALHLYVWPTLLMLAIAGYVLLWMRAADRRQAATRPDRPAGGLQPTRRFVYFSAAFLVLFVAAAPYYLESTAVLGVAGFIARAAASTLQLGGVGAHATGNVLWTAGGGWVVTQECLATPLIPLYFAAICAYSRTWRAPALGMLAVLPIFIALGIVRLLIVALPAAASPLFFVHAFYQLLLGGVIVWCAAAWRHGARAALPHALAGMTAGVLFAQLLGPFFMQVVSYGAGPPPEDPQGAIAFLPVFQAGLYLAVWLAAFTDTGWGRFAAGLAVLAVSQSVGLLVLHALGSDASLTAHVRDVRGWAIAGPLLVVAAAQHRARALH